MKEKNMALKDVKEKSDLPQKILENVDLEDALDLAGAGRYQLVHTALMLFSTTATILEMIGVAFVLPAATCDLQLSDKLRGIITSIPNIGVILTAALWGRASDTLGRKPAMIASASMGGFVGLLAAFMPNLLAFSICKFCGSLFLSSASSLGFAYICEMLPVKSRDRTVLICNGLVMILSTLCPVLAWLILPYEWRYQMGAIIFRPWRLLTIVYAIPLLVVAVCMTWMQESPKFLVTRGKRTEALAVLRKIYSINRGKPEKEYCVKSLSYLSETASDASDTDELRNNSILSLLRPPHLKWLLLTGFLMFGLFSLLNGLFLFAPDTINRMLTGTSDEVGTICLYMNNGNNITAITDACVDTISNSTLLVMVVTTLVYSVIVMAISVAPLSKKTLLVAVFIVVGISCLVSGLSKNRMLAGVAMSSLQITALGIGPLTAYAIHLFPTSLRGTAVGAVMMFGRIGSALGANAAGFFLSIACTLTFYGFSFMLFLCAALSLLLPKDRS